MRNMLPRLLFLIALGCAPAFAQVRVGVELGPIHIRIAPEGPPPPRVEVRLARPGRNHIWIAGYWDRQGERWGWIPGRWELPGRPGSLWIQPIYRREGGAWRYEPAHWSHQNLVEGEDYARWHREHGRDREEREHGRDREERERGRGQDRDERRRDH